MTRSLAACLLSAIAACATEPAEPPPASAKAPPALAGGDPNCLDYCTGRGPFFVNREILTINGKAWPGRTSEGSC
jgi:hypothetical protein